VLLNTWRQNITTVKYIRIVASNFIDRMLKRAMFDTFNVWRVDMIANTKMQFLSLKVILRWMNLTKFSRFVRWCNNAFELKSLRVTGRRIEIRIKFHLISTVLHRWQENVCNEKAMVLKNNKIVLCVLRHCLSLFFDQWRENASEECQTRFEFRKFKCHWRCLKIRFVFHTWIEHLECGARVSNAILGWKQRARIEVTMLSRVVRRRAARVVAIAFVLLVFQTERGQEKGHFAKVISRRRSKRAVLWCMERWLRRSLGARKDQLAHLLLRREDGRRRRGSLRKYFVNLRESNAMIQSEVMGSLEAELQISIVTARAESKGRALIHRQT